MLLKRDPLLLALIGIQLALVWAFAMLPAQDAPAHLNNANVIRHLLAGDVPIFREFYVLNTRPNPNWLTHLVLALLQCVVPPVIAQKLVVSGYLILLPLAARYALRAIRPDAGFLAVLVVPFSMNYLFQKGFYNFCYSLPMFFLVTGYWWKHRDQFTVPRALTFAAMSLLLYFSHPLTLMLGYAALGTLAVAVIVADRRTGRPALVRSRLVLPLAALAPTLVMLALFLAREPGSAGVADMPLVQKLFVLGNLDVLYTFRLPERWLSQAIALIFLAITATLVWRRKRNAWSAADAWLPLAGLFSVLAVALPNATAGGSWITHRLTLFPYFALLLWFAGSDPFPAMLTLWVRFAAATLVLCFAALHALGIAAYQPYLADFLSAAPHVSPQSTLQPVILSETGAGPINRAGTRIGLLARHNLKPFVQLSGLIAAERNLVDLSNYEAQLDYFPTRFREGAATANAEYVLVWKTQSGDGGKTVGDAQPPLDARYDKVFTSPQGNATLYRRQP